MPQLLIQYGNKPLNIPNTSVTDYIEGAKLSNRSDRSRTPKIHITNSSNSSNSSKSSNGSSKSNRRRRSISDNRRDRGGFKKKRKNVEN